MGPSQTALPGSTGLHLLADIGGTKARFALLSPGGESRDIRVLYNREHVDLKQAIDAYPADVKPSAPLIDAAFSVACPVNQGRIKLTNFGWSFVIEELRRQLGLRHLAVINDFTAIALSVPHLKPADLRKLGGDEPAPHAPIGIIGPGTGLGVSGLVYGDGRWMALASEGGHVTLPSRSDEEDRVLSVLRRRYGHVSAERAVSGPGLTALYEALAEIEGRAVEALDPGEVSGRTTSDELCQRATRMFSGMLGTVAGDLALTLGATGGVYIGGGVVHNMGESFDAAHFRERFEDKGRMRKFTAPIPAYAIAKQWPAFDGLAYHLADLAENQGSAVPLRR